MEEISLMKIPSTCTVRRIISFTDREINVLTSLLDTGTGWNARNGVCFLNNPLNALFIAYFQNNPVGFATAHVLERYDDKKAEILLYEIGVAETFRKQGIASQLIEKVKQWAKENDACEIWVLTNKSNIQAVALYESCGFKPENPDDIMYVYPLSKV